jgi:molybdopterin molybdotransferase
MITVEQAEEIIFNNNLNLPTVGVPLSQATGRILRENLAADRDFPPFDRVTMDGIAIRFEDFKKDIRRFEIKGIQAAGMPLSVSNQQLTTGSCFEVMTGAIMPENYDTVIRYEDIKIDNGYAELLIENIDFQQNIHFKGRDRKAGDILLEAGRYITAAEIATSATAGKSVLQVAKLPKIAIISTGDELVDIQGMPLPHQIRRSNVYAIASVLESGYKIKGKIYHFNDDKKLIFNGLKNILNTFDIVILSGAVSEGKYDFVPMALDELGVEKLFHKVSQRPGKPFWFGVKSRNPKSKIRNTVVFAFPGNPVSTFLCAYRYLVPFLNKSFGIQTPVQYAVLSEDFYFKPNLTYFLQVKITNDNGVLVAKPMEGGGSGDLANLNETDGFLELPMDKTEFKRGEVYRLILYRI